MTLPAPVPEIPAANVDKAAEYYVHNLGFTFDWLLRIAQRRILYWLPDPKGKLRVL